MLSALLGSFVSLILFLADYAALTCIALPAAGYLMCIIIFPPPAIFPFLTFVCSGVFIGGMLTAIEGVIQKSFDSAAVLFPIVALAGICGLLFCAVQSKIKRNLSVISVEARLKMGEKETSLTLMVDSGNLALEPVTGRRIIFIGRDAAGRLDFSSSDACYPVSLKSATGCCTLKAFVPDELVFDNEEYNKESFLVLPDIHCGNFSGFDGIAPTIR